MDDDIRPGRLLVATPMLEDPNFRRSVVLVVDHGLEEGTVGVVLNRPTEVEVGRILPPWAALTGDGGADVVFQGGPVAIDSALALAHVPGTAEPLGWRPLDGIPALARVGLVDLDTPPALLAGSAAQFRVFAGYAGWGRDQLAAEIAEDAWLVVAGQTADVFSAEPERLWRHVLRRQGGELAFLATYPDDPTMN
ncbi:YqgE/AlgH family protein [Actinocorallia aurea]